MNVAGNTIWPKLAFGMSINAGKLVALKFTRRRKLQEWIWKLD
jgi:hypothetical protein